MVEGIGRRHRFCLVGAKSYDMEELAEKLINIEGVIDAIISENSKGVFVRLKFICSTVIAPAELSRLLGAKYGRVVDYSYEIA